MTLAWTTFSCNPLNTPQKNVTGPALPTDEASAGGITARIYLPSLSCSETHAKLCHFLPPMAPCLPVCKRRKAPARVIAVPTYLLTLSTFCYGKFQTCAKPELFNLSTPAPNFSCPGLFLARNSATPECFEADLSRTKSSVSRSALTQG